MDQFNNPSNPKAHYNKTAKENFIQSIKYFKENERIMLDGVNYIFHNLKEYNSDYKSWLIEIENINTKQKVTKKLNQNRFKFGDYKIIF